jgi:uncharacterized membrane protein YsdA (DUF1294 family)/cold shock CspA family protein
MKGVVVKFDSGRKFGFIRPPSGDDIFFHLSDLRSGEQDSLVGASVRFEVENGPKGPKAKSIVITAKATSPFIFYGCAAGFIGMAALITVRFYAPQLSFLTAYLIAINLSVFILAGFDKSVAGGGTMRVPERVLFTAALIGGSLGLILGMKFFRHKTKSPRFQFWVLAIVAVQVVVLRLAHS